MAMLNLIEIQWGIVGCKTDPDLLTYYGMRMSCGSAVVWERLVCKVDKFGSAIV